MPFAAGFCHTSPQDVRPRCQPGPAPSTRYVDLTCFRNRAYGAKGLPGAQVNDPAKKSPKVAVMATFSNTFTAKWRRWGVMQSMVS
jgi:hypothetical protein